MNAAHYDPFLGAGGEWKFRIIAANGEIVHISEGYTTKANLIRAMRHYATIVMEAAANLPMVVQTLNQERE